MAIATASIERKETESLDFMAIPPRSIGYLYIKIHGIYLYVKILDSKICALYLEAMERDIVATLIDQWSNIRPDLDARPMRISGRLFCVAKLTQARTEACIRKFGLELWQFDVLATLRRHAKDLSPGQLLNTVMLTSGAMTHRLDRLEGDGFVERRRDQNDRRGVLIRLTPKGRRIVDRIAETRFAEAALIESVLEPAEAATLARLLRKLEAGIDQLPPA